MRLSSVVKYILLLLMLHTVSCTPPAEESETLTELAPLIQAGLDTLGDTINYNSTQSTDTQDNMVRQLFLTQFSPI